MAWYTQNVFSYEPKYSPRFSLRPSPGDAKWMHEIRLAKKIEPEPINLAAVRGQDVAPAEPPDFIMVSSQYVVSDHFRRIVEEIEPGVHQFIPIEVHDRAGQPIASQYWLVNTLAVCDAELKVAEISALRALGRIATREELVAQYGSTFEFVDAAKIAGRHLWRTSGLVWKIFYSDELYRRVRAARLRKLTVQPAIEVSVGR